LPPLDLRTIVLHWTADDDATTHAAYHFVVTTAGGVQTVHATAPLAWNARDVRADDRPYAAHVAGRNSYAIGIALAAMRDAAPDDFGPYPTTPEGLDALCAVAAYLARGYAIPIVRERVFTHAEAAAADGYFGTGADERWDIARFRPDPRPLAIDDARTAGDALRKRIAAHALARR
jgi:N-acetyl-anhydromuramyl-L-alanine amidase AmpD